ncbi:GNAT family N-acetyltransferase [Streptomyces sp. NBC_00932]|uniref:GNAT family N-acetyltransferase n=1 Tax=Streptomyces sp. NBC_00932 TaxID=2903690 RepID=UPI003867944A|nr:GNAT family N-acetyltransferase [Streptomyces sp. NBC_00932]
MPEQPHAHELVIRPLTGPEELPLFRTLPYVLDHELADDLAGGLRRPEWMWVALRGDRVLARAAWWALSSGGAPYTLDFFDLDDSLPAPERVETGVRLLETAMARLFPAGAERPEYGRYIPPDWRTDPVARDVVEARMRAVERTGARLLVERLRLEWTPGAAAAPAPGARLMFRAVRDREDLVPLMTQVAEGSLDAHTRASLESGLSPRAVSEAQYDEELAGYRSPDGWWRIAELPDGDPVGFVIPARNNYHAIIAYIGVLPGHRGHGYIDEILAEGTRILAGQDVPRIRASTDVCNVPMARAFERAGYVNFERAVNMVWD